jgi:Holliday junction resolvase
MSNKDKGSNAERELLHMLSEQGFAVVRVAGSGMISETSADLIAGNSFKKFAIECKTCKDKKRYLEKQQISDLKEFAKKFGFPPIIAVKFNRQGWWFIEPEQLEDTGKCLAISLEDIKEKGKTFDEIVNSDFLSG